jgi:hypothetical protein
VPLVVERRHVREVNARDRERPPAIERLERGEHQLARRCEEDRAVEQMGGWIEAVADPCRAELLRQLAVLSAAAEDIDLAAEVARHLDRDVGGATEPPEAETPPGLNPGSPVRSVADDPGAQQRRRLVRRDARGKPVGKILGHDGVVGIAAVGVPAGEEGGEAEVLSPGRAEAAGAAGAPQPGNSNAIALAETPRPRSQPRYAPHHLVPGNDLRPPWLEIPFHHVQVGAAHAADLDAHQ